MTAQPLPGTSRNRGKAHIRHIGPLNAQHMVVVLERSNVARRSSSIEALLGHLPDVGITVCWYEHRGQRNSRLREAAYQSIRASWLQAWTMRSPLLGHVARTLVRLYLKTVFPKRQGFFLQRLDRGQESAFEDLREFIAGLRVPHLSLLGHSAGGILAMRLAGEPSVARLICFGYPLRHPQRDDEPYRTAPLAVVTKPVLIIQGDRDEYGDVQAARRYPLSPSIELMAIEADHDYEQLSASEFERALRGIIGFLQAD